MSPEEIKKLRKELGWKKSEMARYLGYSSPAVLRWENGTGTPPEIVQTTLYKLRNELDKRKEKEKREFIQGITAAVVSGGLLMFLSYLFKNES